MAQGVVNGYVVGKIAKRLALRPGLAPSAAQDGRVVALRTGCRVALSWCRVALKSETRYVWRQFLPLIGRFCMEHEEVGTRPTRDGFQAVRSKLGRPSSVIRLRLRKHVFGWFALALFDGSHIRFAGIDPNSFQERLNSVFGAAYCPRRDGVSKIGGVNMIGSIVRIWFPLHIVSFDANRVCKLSRQCGACGA